MVMFETQEDSYMKMLGMLVTSGANQGFWSHLGC